MGDTRLLEQRGGVSFLECLELCLLTREFRKEWERLEGKTLEGKTFLPASPIERMIDEKTGYDMTMMREFADFVYAHVFRTFPIAS